MEVVGKCRSVMSFDDIGCTRDTMKETDSLEKKNFIVVGIKVCKVLFSLGMFSNCKLVFYDEYVPSLCAHRPSLFPIEC